MNDKSIEYDLDDFYKFGEIKCLQMFNNNFYVLANRLNNKLGQYLFEIPCKLTEDLLSQDKLKFVIKEESRM